MCWLKLFFFQSTTLVTSTKLTSKTIKNNTRNISINAILRCVRVTVVAGTTQCLLPYIFGTECACAIVSFVACPPISYFPTLYHKWQNFRKKVNENKMGLFIFSTILLETFLILRKVQWDRNLPRSLCKMTDILVGF